MKEESYDFAFDDALIQSLGRWVKINERTEIKREKITFRKRIELLLLPIGQKPTFNKQGISQSTAR